MFNTIEEVLDDLKQGKMIIVMDDEGRENEGDLLCAAQYITPEIINFMAREARGLICIAMTGKVLDRLGIPMMVSGKENGTRYGSPFTVSVEAKTGVTTGISAHDRSRTIKTLVDATSTSDDIVMPGHVFPLRVHPQGVLARRGHTEAGIDLMKISGLAPAAVVCEILDDDGIIQRHQYPPLVQLGAGKPIPRRLRCVVEELLRVTEDVAKDMWDGRIADPQQPRMRQPVDSAIARDEPVEIALELLATFGAGEPDDPVTQCHADTSVGLLAHAEHDRSCLNRVVAEVTPANLTR